MNTSEYGLVGFPLGHSFSKAFFTDKFREEGLDAVYLNFESPVFTRAVLIQLLSDHPCLRGLNVTAPHKFAAYSLADSRTPEAEAAKAANTLRFRPTGSGDCWIVEAHNTDVEGFRESLRPMLRNEIRRALVCGTGGAAGAVRVGLRMLGVDSIMLSRNPEGKPDAIAYTAVDDALIRDYPLIVNATPLGTFPDVDSCPPIPYELIGPDNICFDLVYNPPQSKFLRLAAGRGARTENGLRMLHLQALASWRFWNHKEII